MQALLYVFLGLIFGVVLLGVGIFFWLLLDAVKKLTKAVEEIAPLGKLVATSNLAEGLAVVGSAMPELVKGMTGMNQALALFCQFAFAAPTNTNGKSISNDVNSGFYAYNEQEAASRERVTEAVHAGVPLETAEAVLQEEGVAGQA
jgi:type II secretory pathway component PulF